MAFQEFELNMIPHGDMPTFYASQYETGRPIIIDIIMGEDAFACDELYIELHCRKVDDNIVTLEPDSVDGNQVTFIGTDQLFACPGKNLCEVCLYADETKDTSLGSLNFFIEVEPDPLAGGLTSETQIYDLYQQVEAITEQVIGDDYYDKDDVDALLDDKADKSTTYTKTQVDNLLNDKADKATTYTKTQVDNALALKANSADLATVATTGDYDDLTNKPTIPAAQVQSDYAQADNTKVDYIKNKPDLSIYATNDSVASLIYDLLPVGSASGAVANFTTEIGNVNLVDCKASIVASQASGTPTPSSPLPISGYTGMNLSVCDNDEIAPYLRGCYLGTYGFIDLSGLSYIVESQYSRFKTTIPNLKYVSAAVKANIILKGYTTNTANYFDSHSTEDLQITTDNNTNILYIRNLSCSTGDDLRSALSGKILLYELKTPSTPVITSTDFANILTSFNANGTTYAVSWQDEAGTVYGGNLDLTTGLITVDTIRVLLKDLSVTAVDSSQGIRMKLPVNAYSYNISTNKAKCNVFAVTNYSTLQNDHLHFANEAYIAVLTSTPVGNTADDWIAYFNGLNAELVYKTATTQTYQLTPTPTQVDALLGVNNVFNDTNGDTEVQYKDSIQHYIDTRV